MEGKQSKQYGRRIWVSNQTYEKLDQERGELTFNEKISELIDEAKVKEPVPA